MPAVVVAVAGSQPLLAELAALAAAVQAAVVQELTVLLVQMASAEAAEAVQIVHPQQVLVDPDEQNDWEVRLRLSPSACRAQARVVLEFDGVSPVGGAPDETVAASEG